MPLRLPCLPVQLTPGGLLHSYWGSMGYYRPLCDLYVVGPHQQITTPTFSINTTRQVP